MSRWVAVVDDDLTSLKAAGQILSRSEYRVSALKFGYRVGAHHINVVNAVAVRV